MKKQFRAQILHQRRLLSDQQVAELSQACINQLKKHMRLAPGAIVAGYYPIHHEVDILPFIKELQAQSVCVALPSIDKKDSPLLFRQWQEGDALEKDPYHHILQPTQKASLVDPTIVLVPLVAVDSRGYRLGYGGGYYDRTMALLRAKSPDTYFIGLAYGFQQVDHLPNEPHDQRLNAVVTPDAYHRIC